MPIWRWSYSLQNFKELTREERKQVLLDFGEKPFREKQLFEWISRGASSFEDCTNLSKELRKKLSENFTLNVLEIAAVQISNDGTRKYLLKSSDGEHMEAVFMKYEYGNSICVSTQIGCNMGCVFCASGMGGKIRNLMAWEMLDEFIVVQKDAGEPISHVVLMGMGEPLDNYEQVREFIKQLHDPDGIGLSLRNITLSTCGMIPGIKSYQEDFPQANLAISLHRANQPEREKLMPIAKKYPLPELIAACKEYSEKTRNRVSFEYALISGENDGDNDAAELAKLLRGMMSYVNLIPLNPVAESKLKGSSRQRSSEFAQKLENLGIPVTIRRQLGADIDAACGQLRKMKQSEI